MSVVLCETENELRDMDSMTDMLQGRYQFVRSMVVRVLE